MKKRKFSLVTIQKAAERMDGTGYCLACGKKHSEIEPDGRQYPCQSCGANKVYGAEELLMLFM